MSENGWTTFAEQRTSEMIRRHYSLEHADRVLAMLDRSLSTKHRNFTLSVWSNGREQGYYINDSAPVNPKAAVAFAQQRGSDGIIVILGEAADFDMTTHMPQDRVWEKQKCFYSDVEAVAAITDHMLFYPMKELAKDTPP